MTKAFLDICDYLKGFDSVLAGLTDSKKQSCCKWDLQFSSRLNHLDSNCRIFSGAVSVCVNVCCCFKHQSHACSNSTHAAHLLFIDDSDIRVRKNSFGEGISAHVITVVKNRIISDFLKMLCKSAFKFRALAKGEECFCA